VTILGYILYGHTNTIHNAKMVTQIHAAKMVTQIHNAKMVTQIHNAKKMVTQIHTAKKMATDSLLSSNMGCEGASTLSTCRTSYPDYWTDFVLDGSFGECDYLDSIAVCRRHWH
jgi:hypothetical protein